jgi:uncharacterized SAM-binding protein YcdF (DUF218 family)
VRRREHGGIFMRLLLLLVFLAFLAFFYVIRHPLLRLAGQAWVVNDPAVQADALIVLGDDTYDGDRAAHAADLYRMGLAPIVVASGRLLRPFAGMADMMERDLESRGVPSASIVKISHRGENTRAEADALAGFIAGRGWKRILVVTSNYDARRVRFIFERVLPSDVSIHVSGARDSEFDPSSWWQTRRGQDLFFSEVLDYIVVRWELRRSTAAPAGAALQIPNARALYTRGSLLP